MMAEGRQRDNWEMLSHRLFTAASVAGAKDVNLEDFNKFTLIDKATADAKPVDTKAAMGSLKHLFGG